MIAENENYLQGELSSLAIECNRMNQFNDKEELVLATAIRKFILEYKRILH